MGLIYFILLCFDLDVRDSHERMDYDAGGFGRFYAYPNQIKCRGQDFSS